MYSRKAKLVPILIQLLFLSFDVQSLNQTSPDNSLNNKTIPVFGGVKEEDVIGFNLEEIDCDNKKHYYEKNYTTPSRRVSEIKCLEYIYETKLAEYEIDFDEFCIAEIIIGGRPAFFGEFPHMGALGWRSAENASEWIFKCGATLISEKFMLTSAHCSQVPRRDQTVSNQAPEIVKIGDKFIVNKYPEENEKRNYADFDDLILAYDTYRGQRIDKEMGPKYVPIKRLIKHNQYKSPKRYYDIALIELAESITIGPLIRPACLWSSPDTTTLDKLLITGWGVTDPITRQTTNELQVAEVNLIKPETCYELLESTQNRQWQGLADHQVCAGFLPGGIDTCQGDSGGPLQVKINLKQKWPVYFLVGVTSFGSGCARADTPGVYVKTSSFIDWIENIVWPDNA